MKVEIWSDVMCPFCYIGKRSFDSALAQFEHQDQLEIVWKSFQLDPNLPDVPVEDQVDYLQKRKGMPREQIEGMLHHVTDHAKRVGLDFRFDQLVMVNTFKAHRLIQLAKEKNLGHEAEELLFNAHFVEGKNVADEATLIDLGEYIGLNVDDIRAAFYDDKYSYQIKQDIQEGQSLGVRGVPFFVFDRKYAISGAQATEQFTQTLDKSFSEWQSANPTRRLDVSGGDSCATDGSGAC
ncbi:DsbA family oxidoreductase [Sphingobacterium corticibacter]|uniref:Disulfide bond formation protein DsbA n=1 Tax=Sphingobacterium corticibacter TaxID=2171749 RepID=A0A2T8HIX2_9SPHI|nr:DsbA family oxidoreductase [Sphingobacterium corticibacter]PVH25320.1 disulfide bond formation protein DsbA [Sphingobacterium corticibacter]